MKVSKQRQEAAITLTGFNEQTNVDCKTFEITGTNYFGNNNDNRTLWSEKDHR